MQDHKAHGATGARSHARGEDEPLLSAALRGRAGEFEIDATFSVPGTGVTALFGPSGSGKTTTLRAIAGLHRLAGAVRVGGEVWQADAEAATVPPTPAVFVPPHLRSVGYVFQEASLFPHLTVADNILFATRRPAWRALFSAPPADDVRRRFDELVAVLGIAHLIGRYPARLSGGERQRVAIARAVLPAPRLLLMDEPLSAVDRGTKDEILTYLDVISSTFAMPTLYVSHDLSEITRIADHLVLFGAGQVRAQGAIDDLLTRLDLNPDLGRFEAGVLLSARVAAFDPASQISRLVLLGNRHADGAPGPGDAAQGGNDSGGQHDACAAVPEQSITVPGRVSGDGEIVRLRVRARDVSLAIRRPEGISIRNILPGTLRALAEEPDTGYAETLVQVGPAQVRARITRDAVVALNLEVGCSVFVLIKAISFDGRARRAMAARSWSSSV